MQKNKIISFNSLIIFLACTGMFLSTLDTGIMTIALPFLTKYFHTTPTITTLSISGYTMTLAAVIMLLGVLSDQIGKLKISMFGLTIFGLSSLLAGYATNINTLICFRIIQGIGAAGVQATAIALITTHIDKKHLQAAIGTLGIAIGLGPVLGPTVGGVLLFMGSWRWIFWINVPIIIVSLIVNAYLLKHIKEETRQSQKIDSLGAAFISGTILTLLSGLSIIQTNLALGSLLLITALILLVLLLKIEKQKNQGLLNLNVYQNSPSLGLFLLQTTTFGFTSALIFLFPPFLLEKILGVNSGMAGLFILGTPIGLVIFSRISSKHNNGTKSKQFVSLGLLLMGLSFLLLFLCHHFLTPYLVILFLLLYGVGGGCFQPANIALITSAVPNTIQGEISSLQRMLQNMGIAIGASIGGLILSVNFSKVDNITIGWLIGVLALAIMSTISLTFQYKQVFRR